MKTATMQTESIGLKAKLQDYSQLIKFRLTFTVVLSSIFGYLIGYTGELNWTELVALIIGGFLVVASSNGLNQIVEKDFDILMTRTENRPLAQRRMALLEAAIFCVITGTVGIYLLGHYLNTYAAILGIGSLISYAFIYTPLKRVSSIAVYIGAVPGAIPPLLGWVAATGRFSAAAGILFLIQFVWQFPHFWAIAWVLDDDYKKAGYRLLPLRSGKSKKTAMVILISTILLIPISVLPYLINMSGVLSVTLLLGGSLALMYMAIKLYKSLSIKDAKSLMFASILYNPFVLVVLLIDKI
ncbi:heme o synthase [Bacteroidia bacterium]|nr:protoheme IX farnesyltransferase [Bacteroidota bacterium]MDB4174242.1 heme o synthase [Bacteroidia bacterium]